MMTTRKIALLILMISLGLTCASLYFDWALGLEPCSLCIVQRLAVMLLTVLSLAFVTHAPSGWGKSAYCGLLSLVSLFGLVVASRQVWIQHLPEDVISQMACAPGIDYLLANMAYTEILNILFTATGNCAEINWTFLSLSMAAWMVLWFSLLLLLSLLCWRTKSTHEH